MATYLSFRSNHPSAVELVLVDANIVTGYALVNADFGNAAWEHSYAGRRGTQGARAASGAIKERVTQWDVRILGASADNAATLESAFYRVVDEMRRFGGVVTWRGPFASYRTFFSVITGAALSVERGNRMEMHYRATHSGLFICDAYANGDAMDVSD